MREVAKARVGYEYRNIRILLNREGWKVSRYLAYRPYREEGLVLYYGSATAVGAEPTGLDLPVPIALAPGFRCPPSSEE